MSTIVPAPDHRQPLTGSSDQSQAEDMTHGAELENPEDHGPMWGWWTVHKLQILQDYLQAFVTTTKYRATERIYLDLFAGSPKNIARESEEPILGSVHRALQVDPPFTRLALFEMPAKAQALETAIRTAYPNRPGIKVYPGDCNEQVPRALKDLAPVNWAPTFAFVDQFDSEVSWSTLESISQFRKGKTKAEMWILFGTGLYPRGLNIHGEMNEAYGETLTTMLGTDQWLEIAEARRRNEISAAIARAEWVNLMRWRLEKSLKYRSSHAFTMKNTGGQDIYDMIFVTDHEVGDKIMRQLYAKAMAEHEDMRQHALARRRDQRKEARSGVLSLFSLDKGMIKARRTNPSPTYKVEPPHEPFRRGES